MKFQSFAGQRRFQKFTSVFAAALIAVSIGYVGVHKHNTSHALSVGQAALSMSPASGSYASGATIPVAINVTSGTTRLSVVHAVITYPASQLQLVSIDNGTTFPTVMRDNKTSGNIDIIRAVPGGNAGVAGTNLVVTANFKVIGTAGNAALAFTSSSEAFDDSGSGSNVLDFASSTGATFTIGSSGVASTVPLYRLANYITHERLFTTDANEKNSIQGKNGWVYETIAMNVFNTPGANSVTVYRMANWQTHERLFTTDYNETQYALSHYTGWVLEGTAFYASTNTTDIPVYRLANFITHERLFTTDANEKNTIQGKNGWVYETVAYYAPR